MLVLEQMPSLNSTSDGPHFEQNQNISKFRKVSSLLLKITTVNITGKVAFAHEKSEWVLS